MGWAKLNKNVVFTPGKESDGAIITSIKTGKYFALNSVGSLMLSEALNKSSRNEVISTLIKKLDTDQDTIQNDFNIFIKNLKRAKLINIIERRW